MWHRLKHIVYDLRAYPYISPDLKLRRRVFQFLRQRPVLSLAEWYSKHGKPQNLSFAIIRFAYKYLGRYAGIEFGRILPSDRLEEDLCWTHICWFDWSLSLCDDFHKEFGIDLSTELPNIPTTTMSALLHFLEKHGRERQDFSHPDA